MFVSPRRRAQQGPAPSPLFPQYPEQNQGRGWDVGQEAGTNPAIPSTLHRCATASNSSTRTGVGILWRQTTFLAAEPSSPKNPDPSRVPRRPRRVNWKRAGSARLMAASSAAGFGFGCPSQWLSSPALVRAIRVDRSQTSCGPLTPSPSPLRVHRGEGSRIGDSPAGGSGGSGAHEAGLRATGLVFAPVPAFSAALRRRRCW